MPLRFACPGCRARFELSDEQANKILRCSRCKTAFKVPGPSADAALPASEEPVADAPATASGLGVGILAALGLTGLALTAAVAGFFLWQTDEEPAGWVTAPTLASSLESRPVDPVDGEKDSEKKQTVDPKADVPEPVPTPTPLATVSLPPANTTPLPITAAPADFDKASLPLPGPVTRACLAGGGRFVILAIPSQRQIAVLDVNERKIVKQVPLEGEQPVFTAGLDKLVVAFARPGIIQRWNLLTFAKEATVKSPFAETIRWLSMGHASQGPILAAFQGNRSSGAAPMKFMMLDSFAPFELRVEGAPNLGDGYFVHASANGRCFGMRDGTGDEPHTVRVLSLGADSVKITQSWNFSSSILVPSPDGRFVHSANGIFDTELKRVHPRSDREMQRPYLPAAHGLYFLRLDPPPTSGVGPTGRIAFCLHGTSSPLARLDGVDGLAFEQTGHGQNHDSLWHSERIHFIPKARLLVSIPPTNDRVELRRFDPEEAMEKSGLDYLVVTSEPNAAAKRGQRYAYALVVKSRKGGVNVRLTSGPTAMKLEGRELVWDVPADFADREAMVILSVADASGQEVVHGFRIAIGDR